MSERQLVDEKPHRDHELLRLVIEAAPVAMIVADPQRTIVMANAMAEQLLGSQRRELVGQPVDSVVRPRLRGAGDDLHAVRPDGSEVPVEIGVGALETDGATYAVVTMSDVSERQSLDRERAELLAREQAARADAERVSRLKDEFLATLSHELRTPLNAVIGYASLLSSGALPADRVRHAIDAIQRNAKSQARLVDALLDVSRIATGKLDLQRHEAALVPILEAAIDVVRYDADTKGIAIQADGLPSEITIVGDPARLQQVFWNLLSNAIKFTPAGGRVDVEVRTRDVDVEVTIRDTGQGISAEFLPNVFERFVQADGPHHRRSGGLGLGLALVREIVQAHGGNVKAESAGIGAGSTFTVSVPSSRPSNQNELKGR
jgi:signal transduction histidine kinase